MRAVLIALSENRGHVWTGNAIDAVRGRTGRQLWQQAVSLLEPHDKHLPAALGDRPAANLVSIEAANHQIEGI